MNKNFQLIHALLALTVIASAAEILDTGKPIKVTPLAGDTRHVQGIDVEGSRLWVTSVGVQEKKGYLFEFDTATGKLIRSVELQDGERYHPGGISANGGSLWTAVAEYRRSSTAFVQKRSKRTLALQAQFEVADHIGCIAVTPKELIGANWDAKEIYIWKHDGTLIRKVSNPTNNAFQDLKFTGGQLVGGGLLPDKSGAIDWLEYPSLRPLRRLLVGKTDRGVAYTHEGMTIRGGRLWLLPEDGPSRLFSFRLEP